MSHFTVMVIGDNPEKQLAPYQENNMDDCPQEYLKFHDVTEKYKEKFETETRSEFYCESSSSWGQRVSAINYSIIDKMKVGDKKTITIEDIGMDYFKLNSAYKTYYSEKHEYPEGLHRWIRVTKIISSTHPNRDTCFNGIIEIERINPPKEIPLKEFYIAKFLEENPALPPDSNIKINEVFEKMVFDFFMKDWTGYNYHLDQEGYGYWENPNAKWDWYQLGGRWSGLLKSKSKIQLEALATSFEAEKRYSLDQARKVDIDFDYMQEQGKNQAEEEWEMLMKLFPEGIPKIERSWEEVRKDESIGSLNDRKTYYHNQLSFKTWKDRIESYGNKKAKETFIGFYSGLSDYQCTKEELIDKYMNQKISTFAVLKEGEWYEKGKMGWFGCSTDTEEESDKWNKSFYDTFIKDLPDDTMISIYDCHI